MSRNHTKEGHMATVLDAPMGVDITTLAVSSRVELIEVDRLSMDRYQRDLDEKRAQEYGAAWSEVKAQVLDINERPGGKLVIMDGQHRWAAAKIAGVPALWCKIHQIDPKEEPRYYVAFQTNRKNVRPPERHKALVIAGDEEAISVDRIAAASDVTIVGYRVKQARHTNAVQALYNVHRTFGPDILAEALTIARTAWPDDTYALSGSIILGLGLFRATFRTVSASDLAVKLSTVAPRGIDARAAAMGGSRRAVAFEMVYAWNKGKRNKLDPHELENTYTRIRSEASSRMRRGEPAVGAWNKS